MICEGAPGGITFGASLTPLTTNPLPRRPLAVELARSPDPEALRTSTVTALLAGKGTVVVVVVDVVVLDVEVVA